MTSRELSQLFYLKREIKKDEERLAELRNKMKASATSNPRVAFGSRQTSALERYTAEAIDLDNIISAKITQCVHERNRLERYIADIPDSLLRQIFTARFVNHLSWVQVAVTVGGGNTEEGVRKAVSRYLHKNKEEQV